MTSVLVLGAGDHRPVLRWARHLGLPLDEETLWGENDEREA